MADFKKGSHKGKVVFIDVTGKPWGDGANKTWYFNMKVEEDGKISEGQVGFKSETPKVKADDIITFDKELDAKDRIKFKAVALDVPEGTTKKSYEVSPEIAKQITAQVCYECAIEFISGLEIDEITKDLDMGIADIFYKWIEEKGLDSQNGKAASNALRRVIEIVIKVPNEPGGFIMPRVTDEKMFTTMRNKFNQIFDYYNKKR